MSTFYKRWQTELLINALKYRRIVILSGARQCGKTTLSRSLISDQTTYRTLDDERFLLAAQNDSHSFLDHDKSLMIIDEIQRAPGLLQTLKMVVDGNPRPGQFLLTGSSNIKTLPTVTESLAGRVRNLRLRGLAQGEIEGTPPNFLSAIFEKKIQGKQFPCDQKDVIKRAFRGGYPEALSLDPKERKTWYKDYVFTVLDRDLKEVTNIRRQDSMRSLISILAAWSGKFMDITHIGSHLSLSRATIESYTNALEILFLVEYVKPWIKTDYDRVGKSPKLYMTDCGLMASLLGWKQESIHLNSDPLGKLIETFVFTELATHIDSSEGEYELFQYRDKQKREIDFLIERDDGSIVGIEVKAGSSIGLNLFWSLRWFQENLAKGRPFTGIILYTGEEVLSFGNNMFAVPISALWHKL